MIIIMSFRRRLKVFFSSV